MTARDRAQKVLRETVDQHREEYETDIGDHFGCSCGAEHPTADYWRNLPTAEDCRAWYFDHLAAELMKALEQEMGLRETSRHACEADCTSSRCPARNDQATRLVTGWQHPETEEN